MDKEITRIIQDYYDKHDGDGTFVRDDRAIPFKIIRPPTSSNSPIIVARKTQLVLEALGYELEPESPGFIGRGALPSPEDDKWIRAFVKSHRLIFLGSLDPADMMYFAWLRQRNYCRRLEYLGITDSYLRDVGASDPWRIAYKMSESQQQAMSVVDSVISDWSDIVGAVCSDVLRSGSAIDLDGIAGINKSASSLLTQNFFQ